MRKLEKLGTWSRKLLLLSVLCFFAVLAQAQTVKGIVRDQNGEAIIGATVKVVGAKGGTVTDNKGQYSIDAPTGSILSVSYVGYLTKQIRLRGENAVDVTLMEDNTTLNDIVVVGYGTMKKSDVTGSVVSVDTKQMLKRVPTNVAQALQGAAAGVIVTQQDGSPDANTQVRVRGVGTINGTALPLYVVDGVKVGTDANFLNPADIESMEILKDASATAIYGSEGANGVIMITTKHGQAGHTQVQFTVDYGIGYLPYKIDCLNVDELANAIRTAKANDGNPLDNTVWDAKWDGKRNNIDWQDQMTRTAIKQQYGMSILGGTDKAQYNFSVGYLKNKGLIVNTDYDRLTARAGVKSNVTKYLEVGGDMNYVRTSSHGSNAGLGNNINLSSHRDLAYMTPTLDYIDPNTGNIVNVNVVNPDGSYGTGYQFTGNGWEGNTQAVSNPYATQMELNRIDRSNRIAASAYIDLKFFEGLNLHSIGSWTHTSNDNDDFTGGRTRFNYINGALTEMALNSDNLYNFSLGQSQSTALSIETYLTYQWKTDFNTLSLMAGNTVSDWYGSWVSASAYDFISSTNRQTSLGLDDAKKKGSGAFNDRNRMISYYGRLVYNLFDRYVLTATIRRDGSSNFSKGNQWGTFPSLALGWRIKEESFLKDVEAITNLKLRLGWGQTGNAGNMAGKSVYALSSNGVRYNYYQGEGLVTESNMDKATGFYAPLVDTNLKWETNEQYNVGIDLGLGNFNITADYFVRNTKDLLTNLPIRSSSGYQQIYTNFGTIQNSGVEVSVNYNKQISKDFSINVGLNASSIKNEVTEMTDVPLYAQATGGNGTYTARDGADGIGGDQSNTFAVDGGSHWDNHSISKKGSAVGAYYGWRVEKVISNEEDLAEAKKRGQDKAKLGDFLFKDLDKNGVIDDSDREVLGNGLPSFNWGLNLGATYKNWDFSVYMYGVLGQDILSYSAMRMSTLYKSDDNTTAALLKQDYGKIWSSNNTSGTLPRLSMIDENLNMRVSDAWVKNGNFLKISNVQIGYTFDKEFLAPLAVQSARIYFAVQNLATISSYTQYGDPECGQGSVLFTGLDTGRYPNPRTYMVGLNVTF